MSSTSVLSWLPENISVEGSINVERGRFRLHGSLDIHSGNYSFSEDEMILETTGFSNKKIMVGQSNCMIMSFVVMRSDGYTMTIDGVSKDLQEGEVYIMDPDYKAMSVKKTKRSIPSLILKLVNVYERKPSIKNVEKTIMAW